jgi:hypothetical protein
MEDGSNWDEKIVLGVLSYISISNLNLFYQAWINYYL